MINHVRTLLLNRGRDGFAFDSPGEEYVPVEFTPRRLPTYLRSAHQALFGNNPDRLYMNYRLRQLMTVLHATELEEHVLAFDSRVTYLPLTRDDMFRNTFEPILTTISGTSTLTVEGTHTADDGAGRCTSAWLIEATPPDTITILRQTPPLTTVVGTYVLTRGLSNRIALPGSQLFFRFSTPAAGDRWLVSSNARPALELNVVLDNFQARLGEQGMDQLFPPLADEPIKTFRNLWYQHPLALYRFSGLLLALVTKLNTLSQEAT